MHCIERAAEFNRLIACGGELACGMHRVQGGRDDRVTPGVEQPHAKARIGDGREDRRQRERDQQLEKGVATWHAPRLTRFSAGSLLQFRCV